MTDAATHHDPTGEPMADPAPATSPAEATMLDAFRQQPYDQQAGSQPDPAAAQDLQAADDRVVHGGGQR